ncbi:MAG: alanine racemase [Oscillospiraceae bacterium]|nr:alanine racemase [Oscillospiraceae bacterium]
MLNNSYLLLDTDALAANARALQEEMRGAKLVPVLKDDAYGLGAAAAARSLMTCGIDTFAVSHVSEGLSLREAGIGATIWVMSIPLDFQVDAAAAADLTLTLGSFRQFEVLKAASQRAGKPLPIQLKLDTGLNRIGFLPEELPALAEHMRLSAPYLRCTGSFSHFADNCSTHMDEQFMLFQRMTEQLRALGVEPGLRHISSSASLEAAPAYNLDAVRVGRRLYMDSPTAPTGRIREVATLRAFLTDIRERKAGDTLSYAAAYRLPENATVGVLSVGYGDGLSLDLFERHAPVLVRGRRAKLLACCMDQSFVDLTGIPCQAGDEVTFFGYAEDGAYLSSQEVAGLIGANEGCALTTALTARVARVVK